MLKPWGIEHILYLIVCIILLTTIGIILKKKIKTDKQIEIMFKILGIIGLIAIICTRISLSLDENNFLYLIPDSFCGMTSFLTSLALIFLKKDNLVLHAVWLIGLVGMTTSLLYPDFLIKTTNIFYFSTITCLLHHTITLFNIIMVFVFKYLTITYKKAWTQLVGGIFYIGLGFFLIYVCNIKGAFYIMVPAVKNTKTYFAALLPIYVFVYISLLAIIEFVRYKKRNKNIELDENKPEQ